MSSPLTTTNSMLSVSSPTSATPALNISHCTQRSTRGPERQLRLSAIGEEKYNSLQRLRYQHIAVWQQNMDYISVLHGPGLGPRAGPARSPWAGPGRA